MVDVAKATETFRACYRVVATGSLIFIIPTAYLGRRTLTRPFWSTSSISVRLSKVA
jgi:hypothetical protein